MRDKIARYVTGEISDAERDDIEEWIEESRARKSFVDELKQAWAASNAEPREYDVDAAWKRFQHRLEEHETADEGGKRPRRKRSARSLSSRRRSRRWVSAGIVIVCLFVAVAISMFVGEPESSSPVEPQVYATEAGERTEIQLSDGSTVMLNVDSELRVGDKFGEENREVQLEGEAYFEVEAGSPFVVETEDAQVRVLGTAFGVRSYSLEENMSVTVVEGKVGVNSPGDETAEHALKQRERAVVSSTGSINIASEVSLDQYLGWRQGRLAFHSTPLQEVIWELERTYGHQIWLLDSELADRRLTATFQEESLDKVLEVISLSLDVGYRVRDSTIVFGRPERHDLKSPSATDWPSK